MCEMAEENDDEVEVKLTPDDVRKLLALQDVFTHPTPTGHPSH